MADMIDMTGIAEERLVSVKKQKPYTRFLETVPGAEVRGFESNRVPFYSYRSVPWSVFPHPEPFAP